MRKKLSGRLCQSVLVVCFALAGFVGFGHNDSAALAQETHGLTVHFIDVGQGASTLLAGPDFTVLVDTGNYGADEVVPYLESVGVTSIDLLVGTHPHADHIGQFPRVLRTFPVAEVWMSENSHTTLTYEQALDTILASTAGYYEPRAGETEAIGSLQIEVLSPTYLTGDLNNDSIVLRMVFGNVSILLPGDAEAEAENEMLRSGYVHEATILQLAHHGSNSSSTLAFLESVRPEIAVFSAGFHNDYGHPHDAVIDRLALLGIPVYGTSVHGTVQVFTDGFTYRVDLERHADVPGATFPQSAPPTPAMDISEFTTSAEGCVTGQIDINSASQEELDRIIHIGPERAGQIVRLRPFALVDDLIRVKGIGPVRLDEIKAQGLACVP